MQKAKKPFRIELLQDNDRFLEAVAFIQDKARERYHCDPPPPPQILFAAYREGSIVGTIGLDFGDATRPLPLEVTWEFDRTNVPFPFERECIVQYGRWWAESGSGIGMPLLATATRYALGCGKLHFLVEAQRAIYDHVAKSGCTLKPIVGARLALDRIPMKGRAYYLKEVPVLYMERLTSLLEAAEQKT